MAQNKEKKAAAMKAWHLRNKEKRSADGKAWYLENKEKQDAATAIWYLENKEKHNADCKAWNKSNPEKMANHRQKYMLKLNLANKNISTRTLGAWAAQVKQKDNHTCKYCKSTERLHAHHVFPKHSHPEWALELVNGWTLCQSCHIKIHQE